MQLSRLYHRRDKNFTIYVPIVMHISSQKSILLGYVLRTSVVKSYKATKPVDRVGVFYEHVIAWEYGCKVARFTDRASVRVRLKVFNLRIYSGTSLTLRG